MYSLLLLLLLARIVWDLTPAEIRGLTVAVAHLVGETLVSAAQVADCRAAHVRTARAASKKVHPSLVLSWMMSLNIAAERAEMDGAIVAVVEWVGLMLRLMTQAAELRAARLQAAQMHVFLVHTSR